MFHYAARRGQALVESLVAISVLTIGFLGLLSLLSQSLSLNRVVSNNYIANYLATEGIEIVKNLIDENTIAGRSWATGLSAGTYEASYDSRSLGISQSRNLSFDPATNLYSYTGSVPTPFRRTILLTEVAGDELQVVSEVQWIDRGGGSFRVTLEDHFYKWRP